MPQVGYHRSVAARILYGIIGFVSHDSGMRSTSKGRESKGTNGKGKNRADQYRRRNRVKK